MKLLKVYRVSPSNSATELTIPLSFLDIIWLKLRPADLVFFFPIPNLDSTRFHDSVLRPLKDSLALTLQHYLPLAGSILWPASSPKPILRYTPGDAVSLSVYESAADFHHLSGNHVRRAAESSPLAPSLPISHHRASVIAASVTLFPDSGFCIGTSMHHAVMDAKSTSLFINAWAHTCKRLVNGSVEPKLPPELTPAFDRTAIGQNPGVGGVDVVFLRQWMAVTESLSEGNPRSLKILPDPDDNGSTNLLCGTFELTPADIEKLRNRVMRTEHSVLGSRRPLRLSTFVLSGAYAFTNHLKATVLASSGKKEEKRRAFLFFADYRGRLEVPAPANYIGNCVGGVTVEAEEREVMDADGFAMVAVRMCEAIREKEKGVLRGVEDELSNALELGSKCKMITIAGSSRTGFYQPNFGWGRPEKITVQSTEKTGAISMLESRDGSGGVQIGVVLTGPQMQHFQSCFLEGLGDISPVKVQSSM